MKKQVISVLMIGASHFLQGCAPVALFGTGVEIGSSMAEERGFGGVVSDTALKNTIRYKLMNHDFSFFSRISVLVHQGRALLTGQLDTPEQHRQVVRLVKEVGGIKEIIDEIKVRPSLSIAQITKDGMITTQLNTKLMMDEKIQSINYQVKTEDGVVYILGIAQDRKEMQAVTQHARSVEGVRQVVSHVKLKQATTRPQSSTPHKPVETTSFEETSEGIIPDLPPLPESVQTGPTLVGGEIQHISDMEIQDNPIGGKDLPPIESL